MHIAKDREEIGKIRNRKLHAIVSESDRRVK